MKALGVFPILPTPFTASGIVDEASLRRLIDFELDVGVHGLSILGFMGEAHKLAPGGAAAGYCNGGRAGSRQRARLGGVRAFGAAGAIEQAREAQDLGAAAVFVAPIGVQNDAVLFAFYQEVSEALDIPVAIHDFPESFVTTLSPAIIARIATEIDGVRYIKLEEQPVLTKLSSILELAGDRIGIFGGWAESTFSKNCSAGPAAL